MKMGNESVAAEITVATYSPSKRWSYDIMMKARRRGHYITIFNYYIVLTRVSSFCHTNFRFKPQLLSYNMKPPQLQSQERIHELTPLF